MYTLCQHLFSKLLCSKLLFIWAVWVEGSRSAEQWCIYSKLMDSYQQKSNKGKAASALWSRGFLSSWEACRNACGEYCYAVVICYPSLQCWSCSETINNLGIQPSISPNQVHSGCFPLSSVLLDTSKKKKKSHFFPSRCQHEVQTGVVFPSWQSQCWKGCWELSQGVKAWKICEQQQTHVSLILQWQAVRFATEATAATSPQPRFELPGALCAGPATQTWAGPWHLKIME